MRLRYLPIAEHGLIGGRTSPSGTPNADSDENPKLPAAAERDGGLGAQRRVSAPSTPSSAASRSIAGGLRAAVYDRRRVLWRAPVGVGKRSTPTPAGRFWAREKMRVPSGTIYGRYAIGTSAYSRLSDWPGGGVVGIHGTNQPWLIPGRPSHGCMRLRNPAMARLYRLLPIGAPIRIR